MLVTPAVNVIERQELPTCLTAARAAPAVKINNRLPGGSVLFPVTSGQLICMSFSVTANSFVSLLFILRVVLVSRPPGCVIFLFVTTRTDQSLYWVRSGPTIRFRLISSVSAQLAHSRAKDLALTTPRRELALRLVPTTA